MCQIQSAAAWIAHATVGSLSVLQDLWIAVHLIAEPIDVRQGFGNAHIEAMKGRPKTISGAETSMSISCCVMCAEKSDSPQAWIGETRAAINDNHPHAKDAAAQPLTPLHAWGES